jgi:opacity protein-like surface antigen
MKKQVVLAAALAMAAGGAAQAQMFGPMQGPTPVYIKGFGGVTWGMDQDSAIKADGTDTGADLDLSFDAGYTLGAAVGAQFLPNMAVEVEYAYRRADLTERVRFAGVTDKDGGDAKTKALMLNALYTFDGMGPNGALRPFVGAGVGAAEVEYAGVESQNLWAYQIIGGVGYDLTPNWTLTGEARWFGTETGKFKDDGLGYDARFESVDLLVGATYRF